MQDLKIPSGLDKTSGKMKEVGDVSTGRTCGCICPSCRQGLIAKKGDVLAWHFSHDKDAVDRPVKECDISFESCCRLYAIDLALRGLIKGLRTPAHRVRVHGIPRAVSEAKDFPEVEYLRSCAHDLEARVPGGSIAIFLAYSSRSAPPKPQDPKQGLLAIDIERIRDQYAITPSRADSLRALITKAFTGDDHGKKWIYHPREQAVVEAVPKPFPDPKAHAEWEWECMPQTEPDAGRWGQFACLGCGHTWSGMENINRRCSECQSHLLSKFRPESGH